MLDRTPARGKPQIHTQPVVPELRRGDKRVMFLILEGDKTKNLSGPIREILTRHGVTSPKPQPAD